MVSVNVKSSVEYPCKRLKFHSPKKLGKLETNQKRKYKQKAQKLIIHEPLYKTGVGSGISEG